MRRERRRRQTSRQVHFMYDEDRDLFDAMLAHANAHPEATMVDTLNEFASIEDADIMAKIIYSVNPADFTQTLEKQWQKSFWVVWRWVKSGIKPAAAASQVCSCLVQVIKKTCSGESGSTRRIRNLFPGKFNKEVTQVNSKTREKKKSITEPC
ncbi:hypothetical protein BDR26DRAFT_865314 [Obelidium mucronatum]|nr:hypothetical protein BDR26DRAFT_865314 [Obelidium mucronatum]